MYKQLSVAQLIQSSVTIYPAWFIPSTSGVLPLRLIMQLMVPPDYSGPPTFSCGTTYITLWMISVNVSVIHNNALEFYRANTLHAASYILLQPVSVLFVRLALLTIFTCILCCQQWMQLICMANKMQCLRCLWAYSKHNVANFLMNSLCLGVALMPRSGGFLGFSYWRRQDNKR